MRTKLISRPGYGSVGGVTDSIGSFVKSGFSSALDFYGERKKAEGASEAMQRELDAQRGTKSAGMPGWLLPVGVGVAAIAAVAILRKRK